MAGFARSSLRCWLVGGLCALASIATAHAGPRHLLVVWGVPGSPEHAARQRAWVQQLTEAARGPLAIPPENLVILSGEGGDPAASATREHVRSALERLARVPADGLVCLVLIGHGSFDGADAKFNLVGPDLEAAEWAALLQPIRAQVVVVNTASASAPFLTRLAGPRRVVITAAATPAQRYDTVFAEYFTAAFTSGEADLDKDRRVSIWEAFAYASARVRRYYEQRGQLATERALLDDTGDGIGKEAGEAGPDGALASRLFLDAGPEVERTASPAISELLARRARLLADLDELKRKQSFMPADDYARELERLLVDIARLSRDIRQS